MKDLGNSSNSKVIRDSNNIFVGARMIEDFEEVAESFLAGDVVAFEKLLDHHGPSLMRYTTRLLNSKSLAEDIVQETFFRLWNNRKKYDSSKSKLSTWLHRVAYNLCMDVYRGINRDEVLSGEPDPDSAPEETWEGEETAQRVNDALSKLKERQRSALALTYFHNFSNKEVAEIMGISVDALESLLCRARAKLKDKLQKREEKS